MLTEADNPYRPPAWTGKGHFDHSLFWRVVKACGAIAAVFVAVDLYCLTVYSPRKEHSAASNAWWFFTDWDKAKFPPQYTSTNH